MVSDATMSEADRTVIKDDKALALMGDGNGREIWVFVERVPKKGHDDETPRSASAPSVGRTRSWLITSARAT